MSSKDQQLRAWITSEITVQLKELKDQINHELVEDLQTLRGQITRDVIADFSKKLDVMIEKKVKIAATRTSDEVKREMEESMDKKIDQVNNQLVVASGNQLAVVKQNTKELVLAVGQQVQQAVYTKVIGEINEKIVPKVNNMVQWVNYNMQDGGEVVDSYRRAVEHQSRGGEPGMKLLTDGKNDKSIISESVRLFFDD